MSAKLAIPFMAKGRNRSSADYLEWWRLDQVRLTMAAAFTEMMETGDLQLG
jgi:hypothetical protein